VLISFRLKFVDKDVVLLWSHHADCMMQSITVVSYRYYE